MKNGSQATIGKITQEIVNLQRREMGEVGEQFNVGTIGSSTMPHKSDPMHCEASGGSDAFSSSKHASGTRSNASNR